jgi:hypothetical protein
VLNYSLFAFLIFLYTEGVGKSSLISTFVSRYFSEVVPAIMTRVRLPPDPHTSCITTIVDSQGGDAALIQAVSSSLQKRASDGSLQALLEQRVTESSAVTTTTGSGRGEPHTSVPATTPPRHGVSGSGAAQPPATTPSSSTQTTLDTSTTYQTTAAAGPIENVDSIVLVYDLDRVETFFRLENHWLPLIERCYGGKVRALFADSDELQGAEHY